MKKLTRKNYKFASIKAREASPEVLAYMKAVEEAVSAEDKLRIVAALSKRLPGTLVHVDKYVITAKMPEGHLVNWSVIEEQEKSEWMADDATDAGRLDERERHLRDAIFWQQMQKYINAGLPLARFFDAGTIADKYQFLLDHSPEQLQSDLSYIRQQQMEAGKSKGEANAYVWKVAQWVMPRHSYQWDNFKDAMNESAFFKWMEDIFGKNPDKATVNPGDDNGRSNFEKGEEPGDAIVDEAKRSKQSEEAGPGPSRQADPRKEVDYPGQLVNMAKAAQTKCPRKTMIEICTKLITQYKVKGKPDYTGENLRNLWSKSRK
jgi:hypothetical protein